jgi:uncharacterized protein YunC (DUF1805 family)
MKNMMYALAAFTLSTTAFAQAKKEAHPKQSCAAPSSENYVMMYQGRMMKIVDEKPSPLTKPVTLDNGAIVNVDGSVKLPDGKTITIKENEMVTMSGKMSVYTEKTAASCAAPVSENYVMMYKGRMMKIVNDTPIPLTEPVTLDNGAVVNVDGSVKLPDGKIITIKENEMVTMSGKMSMYTEHKK